MARLIAGEEIEAGQAVYIGPDGRAYVHVGTPPAGSPGDLGPIRIAIRQVPAEPRKGESWRDKPPLL